MGDVQFGIAIISNLMATYAAQDFEAIPTNVPLPAFTYSVQSGDVSLSYGLIIDQIPNELNVGMEDLEIYPDGTIDKIDRSISEGQVKLEVGYIYPEPAT